MVGLRGFKLTRPCSYTWQMDRQLDRLGVVAVGNDRSLGRRVLRVDSLRRLGRA